MGRRQRYTIKRRVTNEELAADFTQAQLDLSGAQQEQLNRELNAVTEGVKRYMRLKDMVEAGGQPPGEKLVKLLLDPITDHIRDAHERLTGRDAAIGPYLDEIPPERLAFITARVIIDKLATVDDYSLPWVALSLVVGRSVRDDRKFLHAHKDYTAGGLKRMGATRDRQSVAKFFRDYEPENFDNAGLAWKDEDCLRLGKWLLNATVEATGCIEYYSEQYSEKRYKRVTLAPEAIEAFQNVEAQFSLMEPVFQPMIIPPEPWDEDGQNGGYLVLRRALVHRDPRRVRGSDPTAPPPCVIDSVNKLQGTGWRVNKKVLAVARQIRAEEGSFPGLDLTPMPLPKRPPEAAANEEADRFWRRLYKEAKTENRRRERRKMGLLRTITTADQFRDEASIYFPHMMDFRGRMYPVSWWLQPQGDDLNRGLLEFSEGRPLGERGVMDIAVHLANCFGQDKLTIEKRLDWVGANWREIAASAEDPMTNRFWTTADEPFCALAAILDTVAADEDPEYVSHLPVSLDGSCNGLQWMAVLTGDKELAEQVNLVGNSETIDDIYSRVAVNVLTELNKLSNEGAKGDPERWGYASMWAKHLSVDKIVPRFAEVMQDSYYRKLTKSIVMTYAYGVTVYGAARQLMNAGYLDGIPTDYSTPKAAAWLADFILTVVNDMLQKQQEMMDYLIGSTKSASKDIVWETPDGFTVDNKYSRYWVERMNTVVGSVARKDFVNQQDARKQSRAVVPNFIHSLDATLMRLVVADCNFPIFGIHDCFMVHAANASIVRGVACARFAHLSRSDHLGDWANQVGAEDPEGVWGVLPHDEIKNSTYAFS